MTRKQVVEELKKIELQVAELESAGLEPGIELQAIRFEFFKLLFTAKTGETPTRKN